MMTRKSMIAAAILLILASGGASASIAYEVASHINGGSAGGDSRLSAPASKLAVQSTTANSISSLVQQLSPAVVDITTTSTSFSFFGGPVTEQGAGTGMIISSDGYILTNNHVLPTNSSNVTVTLSSGKQYKAKVIATDPAKDLGLVKINTTGLSTLTLGDSNGLVAGTAVITIGNALGQFQNTVDEGIISGLNRSVTASSSTGDNSETLKNLIQTDAPINEGNSGGPLIDLSSGTVIGINTAIASNSQGIGFAIPINEAKNFVSNYVSF